MCLRQYSCSWTFALVLVLAAPVFSADIYVDAAQDGSSGTPDGSTWALAYKYLQDGLSAAGSGDLIKIAQGVYHPDDDDDIPTSTHTAGDQDASFVMKPEVIIAGGYRGIDGLPANPGDPDHSNDRDDFTDLYNPVYETILSGDLQNDDVYTAIETTLDDASRSDNSHTVVDGGTGTDQDAILDGVTVRDGHGGSVSTYPLLPPDYVYGGAGIIVHTGNSPRFSNCRIVRNWLRATENFGEVNEGAGMFLDGANSSLITNCLFIDNEAGKGGGMSMHFGAGPTITACTFDRNTASNFGGGGMFMKDESAPAIRDSLFVSNKVPNDPDLNGGGGGALVCTNCEPTFQRCRFESNVVTGGNGGGLATFDHSPVKVADCEFIGNEVSASSGGDGYGGAIALENYLFVATNSYITNSTFRGNLATGTQFFGSEGGALYTNEAARVVNSLFYDNTADYGGGIFNDQAPSSIINATIVENTATYHGGGVYAPVSSQNMILVNNVIWGNNDDTGTVFYAQFCSPSGSPCANEPSMIEATNNNVQDASVGGTVPFNSGGEESNKDEDPKFVNAAVGDFRLDYDSPCIDAGDNTPPPDSEFPPDDEDVDQDGNHGEPTPDLDLSERFKLGNDDTPGSTECSGVVDMGAFEFNILCSADRYGDLNDDSLKDGLDIQPFVDCVLTDSEEQDCICRRGDFVETVEVNAVTVEDIIGFVDCLLTGDCDSEVCPPAGGGPRSAPPDCNGNGVRDDVDIYFCDPEVDPGLCDCNGNGIPDECDIASGADDDNSNGVPDSCEPDCNDNGVSDDLDIADSTSEDCDSNGVPDECDPDCNNNDVPDACELSANDCNDNGIFDACEADCDNDGVPDECELSGNDCNGNQWPDDCEIDLGPPFGAFDCNNNDVPDECELSGNDCNGNGILDACDISLGISEDENANDVPDECESQQMMMLGGQSSLSAAEEAAAWADYFDWCAATDFSEMSHAEVFSAALAKRVELGLPAGQALPE